LPLFFHFHFVKKIVPVGLLLEKLEPAVSADCPFNAVFGFAIFPLNFSYTHFGCRLVANFWGKIEEYRGNIREDDLSEKPDFTQY